MYLFTPTMIFSFLSRRRRGRKKDIKVYGIITVVCFVTAAALTFVIEMGNALIERFDRVPWEELDAVSIERVKTAYGEKIEDHELEDLINDYKKKKGPNNLKKIKTMNSKWTLMN